MLEQLYDPICLK